MSNTEETPVDDATRGLDLYYTIMAEFQEIAYDHQENGGEPPAQCRSTWESPHLEEEDPAHLCNRRPGHASLHANIVTTQAVIEQEGEQLGVLLPVVVAVWGDGEVVFP